MKLKFTGFVIFVFVTMLANAQEVKKDTVKKNSWRCITTIDHANRPLYICDGKMIAGYFFYKMDPEDILELTILKTQQAMSIYGEKGKNGAVICKTKMKVEWISSEEIFQQEFKNDSCKTKKLIFKSDYEDDLECDQTNLTYFDKKNIKIDYSSTTEGCVVILNVKK